VISSASGRHQPGNSLPLRNIPLGHHIHNVELNVAGRAQMVRSAGSWSPAHGKEASGEVRWPSGSSSGSPQLPAHGRALGNSNHRCTTARPVEPAGLVRRPHNRGVTMNPVDHPMGGGEGPVLRWPPSPVRPGELSKAQTRQNKRTDRMIVKPRGKEGVAMARSLERRIRDGHLMTNVTGMQQQKVIEKSSRLVASFHHHSDMVGLTFAVQTDASSSRVRDREHGGHKLGEFSPTPITLTLVIARPPPPAPARAPAAPGAQSRLRVRRRQLPQREKK